MVPPRRASEFPPAAPFIASDAMISSFIASYGYWAVFLGTLLEGETILLAAGFAAYRGLLDWRLVLAIAIVGATLGDQCAFLLGRWKGPALIARVPVLTRNAPRFTALMDRYHTPFILVLRFLYGLRIAGPVMLGAGNFSPLQFAPLNLLGAVLWAPLVIGAGYTFGVTIESLLVDLRHIEEIILIGILAAGFVVWVWRRKRDSR